MERCESPNKLSEVILGLRLTEQTCCRLHRLKKLSPGSQSTQGAGKVKNVTMAGLPNDSGSISLGRLLALFLLNSNIKRR